MQSCPFKHVQAGKASGVVQKEKNKWNKTTTQDLFYRKTTTFCNLLW